MTRDDILALQEGPKLDALIAERIFGMAIPEWVPTHEEVMSAHVSSRPIVWLSWPWRITYWGSDKPISWKPRVFSSDMAAAWEVVEKLRNHTDEDGFNRWYFRMSDFAAEEGKDCWHARFKYRTGTERFFDASAPTAQLAICRAAILATLENE